MIIFIVVIFFFDLLIRVWIICSGVISLFLLILVRIVFSLFCLVFLSICGLEVKYVSVVGYSCGFFGLYFFKVFIVLCVFLVDVYDWKMLNRSFVCFLISVVLFWKFDKWDKRSIFEFFIGICLFLISFLVLVFYFFLLFWFFCLFVL